MLRILSITSLGLVLAVVACSSDDTSDGKKGGTGGGGAVAGSTSGSAGKPAGTGGSTGGGTGMTGGTGTGGGTGGGTTGGTGGGGTAGAAVTTGGSAGMTGTPGGSAGIGPSTGGAAAGGSAGAGMTTGGAGGSDAGMGGTSNVAPQGPPSTVPPLVTSASGAYWKTEAMLTEGGTAVVTVNDTMVLQKWDGFGGAFNERGWTAMTSADMQAAALKLLFSATDGAAFAWGRIPIGASDYADTRYTCDMTATDDDPMTMSGDSNRPPADTALAKFSLDRDNMKLIPYVLAAKGVNPLLRFWASPWTPPVWMKTGFKTNGGGSDGSGAAVRPSYYDGGNMKKDDATLEAYAQYYVKFVNGYKDKGINIEIVSPQNEPGYDQNYPSCLWDGATYAAFVGKHLGPAMQPLGVKIMLGTLSNDKTDFTTASSAFADSSAKPFFTVIGAQWNTLDKSKLDGMNTNLPVWATEHKCGNYPWCTTSGQSGCPGVYDSSKAPNDQAYGEESWGYIRDAIKTVKVTSYSAWNMVLDKDGLGNDVTRLWKQDALLVAGNGMVTPTPAYYVFRHMAQYVVPGANVVGTTGGDAVAFKNPDGSIAVTAFNSGAANASYGVAVGGKTYQVNMPSHGWATVLVRP